MRRGLPCSTGRGAGVTAGASAQRGVPHVPANVPRHFLFNLYMPFRSVFLVPGSKQNLKKKLGLVDTLAPSLPRGFVRAGPILAVSGSWPDLYILELSGNSLEGEPG